MGPGVIPPQYENASDRRHHVDPATLSPTSGAPGSLGSLGRLREDARWWFGSSEGDIRVVMLLVVDRGCEMVGLKMWRVREPGEPYVVQTVRITASGATGDLPLVIYLGVLLDQDGLKGKDIVLDAQTLVDIVRSI